MGIKIEKTRKKTVNDRIDINTFINQIKLYLGFSTMPALWYLWNNKVAVSLTWRLSHQRQSLNCTEKRRIIRLDSLPKQPSTRRLGQLLFKNNTIIILKLSILCTHQARQLAHNGKDSRKRCHTLNQRQIGSTWRALARSCVNPATSKFARK